MSDTVAIELMSADDARSVFDLVRRGFESYVKADCTDEGREMFFQAVQYILHDHSDEYVIFVARSGGAVVGMIALGKDDHICLFFVDTPRQGSGIGRALFEAALERWRRWRPSSPAIDVHASLFAVPIYERLGFERQSDVECQNGIQFVKLLYRLR